MIQKFKEKLWGRKKVAKDVNALFQELENNENAPSIMDFTSNEAQRILGPHKPTKFLKTLCKAIYYYETHKSKAKEEKFDFSQLETSDVVDSLDELTSNHSPSEQGYKVLKIALYMLLMTESSVSLLHEANPVRARVFTILSALAYRLLHVTNKATLAETVNMPAIPGKTVTEQYSVCQTAALSLHQDTGAFYFKSKAQQPDDNPWTRIHQTILRRFRKTSLGIENTDPAIRLRESFMELAGLIVALANSFANAANEFYEGKDVNNPVTPLKVKTREIRHADRNSLRIQELNQAGYLDAGKWGYAANFTLLSFQRSLSVSSEDLRTNVSVNFFKGLDETHMDKAALGVHSKLWKKFVRKLVHKRKPEKFNSVHLLFNHFEINSNFKPKRDRGFLSVFGDKDTCDDALYRLENNAIDIHLTRL